jgi:hypothetical protein
MRITATGRRAAKIRAAAIERYNLTHFAQIFSESCRDLERLDVTARRGLLVVARHLLERWPRSFVEFCKANRVWSSTLLRDLDDVPFWYWNIVNEHLYRPPYQPSEEEIESAVTYIRCRNLPLNKESISRLLGARDVRRKRRVWKPEWEGNGNGTV